MKRSKHSLSHYKLLTAQMGKLIPISCFEVLPGDSVQQMSSLLLRTIPLAAPVMHPCTVRVHHWYVPHRLVWDGWEDFITGGADGQGGSSGAFPYITTPASPGVVESSLADYLGIPVGVISRQVSALPFRSYAKIFNEWYRDEDLVTAVGLSTGSGADSTTSTTLQNIAWEKDRFTAARPWPQKGPDVTLPLGTVAPVEPTSAGAQPLFTGSGIASAALASAAAASANTNWTSVSSVADAMGWLDPKLQADLSAATAVDVNTVREAFALQRYQEARARYGSRYTEYLRYLGVRSSDARLQRPEYLGGGKQTISFSEVLQTGVTTDGDDTEGVGNMRGHGLAAMRSNRYRRFFEEHGCVISLLSVRPRTMYPDGLERMWLRRSKEEYWQKELEMIGQQEIQNQECYALDSAPTDVFGYEDRYAEYKHIFSKVSGAFRSTLDFWHLARLFGSDVTLNASFVNCAPDPRIFQVTTGDNLLIMASHSIQARRMVSRGNSSRIM